MFILLLLTVIPLSVFAEENTKSKNKQCKSGTILIILFNKKFACFSENTAKKLVRKGVAKYVDVEKMSSSLNQNRNMKSGLESKTKSDPKAIKQQDDFSVFWKNPENFTVHDLPTTPFGTSIAFVPESIGLITENYSNSKWGIAFPVRVPYAGQAVDDDEFLRINLFDYTTYFYHQRLELFGHIRLLAIDSKSSGIDAHYQQLRNAYEKICWPMDIGSTKILNGKKFDTFIGKCEFPSPPSLIHYVLDYNGKTYFIGANYYDPSFLEKFDRFVSEISFVSPDLQNGIILTNKAVQ